MPWISESVAHISWPRLEELMHETVAATRRHICAATETRAAAAARHHPGTLAAWAGSPNCSINELAAEAEVHVIPTLGQHVPHTPDENRRMFGSIPNERIHAHDWRDGCVHLGEVSADYVREACGGVADWPIPDASQPHADERAVGLDHQRRPRRAARSAGLCQPQQELLHRPGRQRDRSAPRTCWPPPAASRTTWATWSRPPGLASTRPKTTCWATCPTCTCRWCWPATTPGELVHTGVFVGDDLETYLQAARQSREQNITVFDEPIQKMVCVMQADEFVSTWVANKAVYRTRMALADGGELVIIAPGLKRFGEQPEVDAFIRKYGYCGTPKVMAQYAQERRHAGPGARHGPSDSRLVRRAFHDHLRPGRPVTGRDRRRRLPVRRLGRNAGPLSARDACSEGWNTTADGERFYFIPTPSAGLWATREKLYGRTTGFGGA